MVATEVKVLGVSHRHAHTRGCAALIAGVHERQIRDGRVRGRARRPVSAHSPAWITRRDQACARVCNAGKTPAQGAGHGQHGSAQSWEPRTRPAGRDPIRRGAPHTRPGGRWPPRPAGRSVSTSCQPLGRRRCSLGNTGKPRVTCINTGSGDHENLTCAHPPVPDSGLSAEAFNGWRVSVAGVLAASHEPPDRSPFAAGRVRPDSPAGSRAQHHDRVHSRPTCRLRLRIGTLEPHPG
jgi:hypothetical protein